MDRFARVILGYHGCDRKFADELLSGETTIEQWKPSRNSYDWLGHGIYFWEHAPERALLWAKSRKNKGVIGAVIQLGLCLDLTDTLDTELLALQHRSLQDSYLKEGRTLPENRGNRRDLDCLVINELVDKMRAGTPGNRYQTIRCPFLEGDPAFPGSGILKESHIQVSVVDTECILGVFRPNFAF